MEHHPRRRNRCAAPSFFFRLKRGSKLCKLPPSVLQKTERPCAHTLCAAEKTAQRCWIAAQRCTPFALPARMLCLGLTASAPMKETTLILALLSGAMPTALPAALRSAASIIRLRQTIRITACICTADRSALIGKYSARSRMLRWTERERASGLRCFPKTGIRAIPAIFLFA